MISESLAALSAGDNISEQRSYNMMMEILDGTTSDEQNTQMLNALCSKGETDDEVSGMLRAMRQAVVPVKIDNTDAIDVCGTGGDGLQTVNISTAAMFVASSVGCSVAKHGNRSSSGAVGSADIFESLGCNLQEDADQIALCMEKTNVLLCLQQDHLSASIAIHVFNLRRFNLAKSLIPVYGKDQLWIAHPSRILM